MEKCDCLQLMLDIVYVFEKINDFSDEACKESLLDKIRFALARYSFI